MTEKQRLWRFVSCAPPPLLSRSAAHSMPHPSLYSPHCLSPRHLMITQGYKYPTIIMGRAKFLLIPSQTQVSQYILPPPNDIGLPVDFYTENALQNCRVNGTAQTLDVCPVHSTTDRAFGPVPYTRQAVE